MKNLLFKLLMAAAGADGTPAAGAPPVAADATTSDSVAVEHGGQDTAVDETPEAANVNAAIDALFSDVAADGTAAAIEPGEAAPVAPAPAKPAETPPAGQRPPAQGQPAPATQAPPAEETPEQKTAREKAEKDAEKAAMYEPPRGLGEKSSDRWKKLTDRCKEADELEARVPAMEAELGQLRQYHATREAEWRDLNVMFGDMQKAGMDERHWEFAIDMNRILNGGGTPEEEAAVFAKLTGYVTGLSQATGTYPKGWKPVDPLAGHPDLQADVESMATTQERAEETARHRNQQAMRGRIAQGKAERDQQRAAEETRATNYTAAQNTGMGEVNALDAGWKAAGDPHYAAKRQIIQQTVIPLLWDTADPKTWKATVESAWARLGKMPQFAATAPVQAPAAPVAPVAPRPTQVAAPARPAPNRADLPLRPGVAGVAAGATGSMSSAEAAKGKGFATDFENAMWPE